ncbi:MAG: hypothetical protein HUK24_04675 [Sphaerochaetaceae bacterium]|nr:hypothetical protein [Sphaerochaetaceae bacterium]
MDYGLIGEKLGHSYSKEIHKNLGNYEYELLELERGSVEKFLKEKTFKGINVTIPYKEVVMPYVDVISPEAKSIGSINTVVNKKGTLYGYNTDAKGMEALFKHKGVEVKNKNVAILGTGGTAKTAKTVVTNLGAKNIYVFSREAKEGVLTYSYLMENKAFGEQIQVIVNTTPCGMFPKVNTQAVNLSLFPNLEGIIDVVYNPLRTNLVQEGEKKGIPSEGGLFMLASQAVYASAYFLDKEPNGKDMKKAYVNVLKQKLSIVLIGMPTCGKTTVGKALSKALGLKFIDTDEEIKKIIGISISDYFSQYGEKAFRTLEKEVVQKVSLEGGCVIATGGGVPLDEENIINLKHNGFVVFMDRSPENLLVSKDRPLSSTLEALRKRYEERYPIYTKSCDLKVDCNGTVEENTNLVMSGYNEYLERGNY